MVDWWTTGTLHSVITSSPVNNLLKQFNKMQMHAANTSINKIYTFIYKYYYFWFHSTDLMFKNISQVRSDLSGFTREPYEKRSNLCTHCMLFQKQ